MCAELLESPWRTTPTRTAVWWFPLASWRYPWRPAWSSLPKSVVNSSRSSSLDAWQRQTDDTVTVTRVPLLPQHEVGQHEKGAGELRSHGQLVQRRTHHHWGVCSLPEAACQLGPGGALFTVRQSECANRSTKEWCLSTGNVKLSLTSFSPYRCPPPSRQERRRHHRLQRVRHRRDDSLPAGEHGGCSSNGFPGTMRHINQSCGLRLPEMVLRGISAFSLSANARWTLRGRQDVSWWSAQMFNFGHPGITAHFLIRLFVLYMSSYLDIEVMKLLNCWSDFIFSVWLFPDFST